MIIKRGVFLKNYTTFKIGGPAKYFLIVKTQKDLAKAILLAKKQNLPFFILGGGSNLLVSDKGFDGLVIQIKNQKTKIKNSIVTAGAGVSLAQLLSATANAGLSGMEWAAGIPGATVGGAVRGNAGAFETEMKDIVAKVEAFDAKSEKIKIFNNKSCRFGYRESVFKKNPNLIIFSAELALRKSDKGKVKQKVKEILGYRTGRHPKFPSAGSIFKNLNNVRARDLIEKAGLKAKKVGQAQISDQHANFIVNLGNAKASDVLSLINLAKRKVKKKFKISLKEEIQYLSPENH